MRRQAASLAARHAAAIQVDAHPGPPARSTGDGDHTVSHPYLTRLSDEAVRQEILGAARQITAVTGKSPLPLFRFPFGDADARTIAIANQAGYVPVRWTVDALGWEGTAGHITAPVVASRVLGAARSGEIVLMHVGSNPDDHTTLDADALPRVISALRAQGYSFVTLDALTGEPARRAQGGAIPQGRRDGVVTEFPSLALQSSADRVGASLQAGEEDGYGSDDAVHDRVGPACTDGACGTVSRSAGGGTLPMSPVAAPGLAARSAGPCTAAR